MTFLNKKQKNVNHCFIRLPLVTYIVLDNGGVFGQSGFKKNKRYFFFFYFFTICDKFLSFPRFSLRVSRNFILKQLVSLFNYASSVLFSTEKWFRESRPIPQTEPII